METKSKTECWNEFWAIIGPALVDLHREGKLPDPQTVADAA